MSQAPALSCPARLVLLLCAIFWPLDAEMEKCLVPRTMRAQRERKSVNPSWAALRTMPFLSGPHLKLSTGSQHSGYRHPLLNIPFSETLHLFRCSKEHCMMQEEILTEKASLELCLGLQELYVFFEIKSCM